MVNSPSLFLALFRSVISLIRLELKSFWLPSEINNEKIEFILERASIDFSILEIDFATSFDSDHPYRTKAHPLVYILPNLKNRKIFKIF